MEENNSNSQTFSENSEAFIEILNTHYYPLFDFSKNLFGDEKYANDTVARTFFRFREIQSSITEQEAIKDWLYHWCYDEYIKEMIRLNRIGEIKDRDTMEKIWKEAEKRIDPSKRIF